MNQRRRIIRIFLAIVFVLIVAAVVLMAIDNDWEISLMKQPKKYLIEDECGLVVGNLLHQIKDEGECRIKCRNECGIRQQSFYDSEFIKKENACHICNCYCK